MTTAVVKEIKRLSPHANGLVTPGRAELHARQVAYVRASLLRGIDYPHGDESAPQPGRD